MPRLLEYIQKATLTTSDFTGSGNGGYLAHEQAKQFLRDAVEATVVLNDAEYSDSANPIYEIPKIDFATRILRSGTEGARLGDSDRVKPNTDLVTMTTQLFKGEVPISDETYEDNIERAGLADTLMEFVAQACGRDMEQIAIMSDTADASADFNKWDGVIQSLYKSSTGNKRDATNDVSYKGMFKAMLDKLPSRYRSLWSNFAFYVPVTCADGYADELAARGTGLGDGALVDRQNLRYRSIPVKEVPLFAGTQNAVDYSKFAYLAVGKNLKAGFHRRLRVEKFRDPREGAESFAISLRYTTAWAQDSATVLSYNVPALAS